MTKYRLKKDTPEFEAGQMFTRGEDEDGNDCLFAGGAPLPAFDVSLIDNFDEWFEEVKQSSWEKPKVGDIYYIAYPDGVSVSCTWDGCPLDENRFSYGACFKTKKAADAWRNYLKAIATVRQDEGFMKTDFQGSGYCMRLHFVDADEVVFDRVAYVRTLRYSGAFFFDTEEHAKQSIIEHRASWRTILEYDWSRE